MFSKTSPCKIFLAPLLVACAAASLALAQGTSVQGRKVFQAVPGPDAEYLVLKDSWIANADGSIVHERTVRLQINSFLAFNRRYNESRVEYDPTVEKLEVLYNRTKLPSGVVVNAPANAIVDDQPPSAHGNPLWAGLRRRIIVHTALEPGAVIELSWRMTRAASAFPWLEFAEPMAAEIPIKERIVEVVSPTPGAIGGGVTDELGRGDKTWANPQIAKSGNQMVTTWRRENVAAINEEAGAPGREIAVPMLRSSKCPRYETLVEELARRVNGTGKAPEGAITLVRKAIEKETAWEAKLLMAMEVLPKALTVTPILPSLQHWQPRAQADVWRTGVATPMELAIMQAAVINEVGIKAHPVLLGVRGQNVSAGPAFAGFDRPLVRVQTPEGVWRLYDPADAGRGRPIEALLDAPILIPGVASQDAITPANLQPWRRALIMTGEITNDGAISGKLNLDATQAANPHAALVRDPQKVANELGGVILEGKAKDARVTTLNRTSSSLTASVEGKLPEKSTLGLVQVDFVGVPAGVDKELPTLPAGERFAPIALPGPGIEELDVTLTLPKGWKVASHLVKANVSNSLGSVVVKSEVTSDGQLHVIRRIELKDRIVGRELVSEVRALLAAWTNPAGRTLLLRPSLSSDKPKQ